ncbi:MAG TPA: hypothetical protein DD811_09605 [Syntrophomonas sp.]|jgi:hypothetical protein|nr:hypothetical protein [Syntrophomonas sp.]
MIKGLLPLTLNSGIPVSADAVSVIKCYYRPGRNFIGMIGGQTDKDMAMKIAKGVNIYKSRKILLQKAFLIVFSI